jgi:hypothetical protein
MGNVNGDDSLVLKGVPQLQWRLAARAGQAALRYIAGNRRRPDYRRIGRWRRDRRDTRLFGPERGNDAPNPARRGQFWVRNFATRSAVICERWAPNRPVTKLATLAISASEYASPKDGMLAATLTACRCAPPIMT